jgi:hypothetical protein
MSRPDDVEIRVEASSAIGGDDVVELVPRRITRATILAACLTLAALTAVATPRHRTSHGQAAAPSVSQSVTSSPTAAGLPDSELGSVVALDSKPVLDVVMSPNTSWTLQSGQLVRNPASEGIAKTAINDIDFNSVISSVRLFLDRDANRVWLAVLDTPNGKIIEFDTSLRRLRTTRSASAISAAAAMGGHLYLATRTGVTDLAPGAAAPRLAPGTAGAIAAIAADRTRSRILALRYAPEGQTVDGARILQFRPGPAPTTTSVVVPLAKGGLAVTGNGDIWAGGFGSAGAVLVRLDPTTLSVAAVSPAVTGFGPGAVLVAAGRSAIWLRSGAGGNALYCLDGHTGVSKQVWSNAPGAVASELNIAWLASGTAEVVLELHGCPG